MTHKNRAEQLAEGARKDPKKRAWKTRVHHPKVLDPEDFYSEIQQGIEEYEEDYIRESDDRP